jgi:hypothetical protein
MRVRRGQHEHSASRQMRSLKGTVEVLRGDGRRLPESLVEPRDVSTEPAVRRSHGATSELLKGGRLTTTLSGLAMVCPSGLPHVALSSGSEIGIEVLRRPGPAIPSDYVS